ncbi:MAG: phage Gp37/Gp68 family protein [Armatimonadetes bacterium]|nr:phage Gp37/Gp68 family protein [Armatimonadota bacterium]
MAATTIEWTEATWNPVTGCSKVSAGCANCYAERMARRLQAMGQPNYRDGFAVRCHPHMLDLPLRWRKPQMVFVNSMSDLFHEDVPLSFIQDVFTVMDRAHWHVFQVLTKRSERLLEIASLLDWTPNIWAGVTVESGEYLRRCDDLRMVPAAVRFVSFEPLIGPVPQPDLSSIHWAIVGGESGPGARPMQPGWVLDIRDACREQGVPFFFKQWGGCNKKKAGRLLEGRTWDAVPRVRLRGLAVVH